MEEDLQVRPFRREDLDRILEIEAQAFPKSAYSRETFLIYARKPGRFIVLEVNGRVAAYLIYDRAGHIHSMAVDPLYRRRGLGRVLFTRALASVEKGLWLEVRSRNTAAAAFYRSMGMEVIGRIPDYYGDDDALVMVLKKTKDQDIVG